MAKSAVSVKRKQSDRKKQVIAAVNKLRDKFVHMRDYIQSKLIERTDAVNCAVLALMTGQHLVLLGVPGTAKSMLARLLCHGISGGLYFERCIMKGTMLEELLGPVSLKGLEADRFYRITASMLPEAHVAFLDEVFKANSPVLNTLLPLLNERIFYNEGNQPMPVPLRTCIMASNEMPPEVEGAAALWDRIVFRLWVDNVSEGWAFINMLKTEEIADFDNGSVTIQDLDRVNKAVHAVGFPDYMFDRLNHLRQTLASQDNSVVTSDRMWKRCIKILKAWAFLCGDTAVDDEHIDILRHVLWQEPEQIAIVNETITKMVSQTSMRAKDITKECGGIVEVALAARDIISAGMEANTKLQNLRDELDTLLREFKQSGKPASSKQGKLLSAADKAWNEAQAKLVSDVLEVDVLEARAPVRINKDGVADLVDSDVDSILDALNDDDKNEDDDDADEIEELADDE